MKSSDLKKECAENLAELIIEIDTDKSDKKLKEYLGFCASFYKYSFHNTLMIFCYQPHATHVAGFKNWQKLGRTVRKGEKGIPIFAPIFKKQKKEEDKEDEKTKIYFRVVHVFDVSQTEGKALPATPDTTSVVGYKDGLLEKLEQHIKSSVTQIEYTSDLRGSDGTASPGKIKILKRLNSGERFAIAVHEFAHILLHMGERRLSARIKEIEAESVAYIVCRHFGIKTQSTIYLNAYNVQAFLIEASLANIVRTSSGIIKGIEIGDIT